MYHHHHKHHQQQQQQHRVKHHLDRCHDGKKEEESRQHARAQTYLEMNDNIVEEPNVQALLGDALVELRELLELVETLGSSRALDLVADRATSSRRVGLGLLEHGDTLGQLDAMYLLHLLLVRHTHQTRIRELQPTMEPNTNQR